MDTLKIHRFQLHPPGDRGTLPIKLNAKRPLPPRRQNRWERPFNFSNKLAIGGPFFHAFHFYRKSRESANFFCGLRNQQIIQPAPQPPIHDLGAGASFGRNKLGQRLKGLLGIDSLKLAISWAAAYGGA